MATVVTSTEQSWENGKPIDTTGYVPSDGTKYLVQTADGMKIVVEDTAYLEANWEGNFIQVNKLTSLDKLVLTYISPTGVTTSIKKIKSIVKPEAGTGLPPTTYFSAINGGNPVPPFCTCVFSRNTDGTYVYAQITSGA